MPVGFTSPFAQRLNALCRLDVAEAGEGEKLLPGRVRIAPAGRHQFRMRGGGTSGELVVFDVGPDGRATAARVATSSIKIVRKAQ